MSQNSRPYDAAAAERSIMHLLPSSQHPRQNHSASMVGFGGNGGSQIPLMGCQQQQQLMSPPASGRSMPQQPTASAAAGGEQLKQSFYNPYQVKHRRRTTKDQLALLEGTFEHTPKPSSELRKSLASNLCMTAREVQIWFQNRRAKQKNINMRATSATKTSADCSPVLSPVDMAASPTDKLERAGSAEHPAAVATKETHRRHSDIPVSFIHCEPPLGVATCGPIENQLAAAAAALLPSTAMVATMPATAHVEPSPPPALATQPSTCSPQRMLFQQTLDAAAAAAASSSSMPCAIPTHHHPPPPSLPPKQQQQQQHLPHKKHKHSAGGRGSNTDRYHTARVHQEAFDGTNKLPLKPDDFSPHSADDQFSMLDPSNLPMFMMPMHGGGPNMVGASNIGSSMSFSSPGHQSSSMPGAMSFGAASSSMYWNMPYASQHQQPGFAASSSMPSTDMSTLFNGLLGLSPTSPYSSMPPPPPMSSFGLPAAGNSSSTVGDLPAYNVDTASSIYQTLMYLSQQGAAVPGTAAVPPALGHQRQRASDSSQLLPPPEMSPLSPAESVAAALASSPPGSHRQMNLTVDTSAAALMSPPAGPGSAFASYESHGHSKNQMPSLHHQQQHPVAIFMPSGTVAAAAASAVYPHLVSIASTDAAEMFGSVSSGNANVSTNGGLL
ncbi:hypothetical protein GGI01_000684 [Coemansia sp. RSA 376]|nr:hypothetical protein GGI14_001369 [Coemansia sp. S680]KAJ2263519.1 hypothetical protein GGI01_000684 [Coemansia sp. RSA 376]